MRGEFDFSFYEDGKVAFEMHDPSGGNSFKYEATYTDVRVVFDVLFLCLRKGLIPLNLGYFGTCSLARAKRVRPSR